MYYFGGRYYDSEVGRFISEDPGKQGVNWYSYCDNNPLRYVDPDGRSWRDYYNNIVNFSAGFNETVSFGLSRYIVHWITGEDDVDRSSGWYLTGEVSGLATSVYPNI